MTWCVDLPRIEELLRGAETLIGAYEPSALTYLDSEGRWQIGPATLADRVSCELWFRIWEARNAGGLDSQVAALFLPLIANESSWQLVGRIQHGSMHHGSGASRACSENQGLLAAVLALNLLVEFDAYESISSSYAAEWDRKAKATKALHAEKLEILANRLGETLAGGTGLQHFLALRSALKAAPDSIFNVVSEIISEEVRVRSELDDLLAELRLAEDKEEICELISAYVCPHPSISRREPRALLRPCVELLASKELDVSSGIQYRASAFLGRLADPRSSESLMEALRDSAPAHTFLRSNLVFALGNLREKRAVPLLTEILDGPDHACVPSNEGRSQYLQPLDSEKREAVWALGKLGADAVAALPSLTKCVTSPDRETRIYLAWAMGMIGAGQKQASGGIDATIPIALMNLLTGKDAPAFEEATFGLRKLGLPDFLHTLYLRDFKTVPILSLKPSSTGLYELSETLLHLASVKRPVVMAVTGDSGTGKTYFCNTIARGFSRIEGHEILYLMRDGPENRVFDRILGLKWLKAHNEARFCENYPVSEDQDEPDAFFEEFLRHNAHKKLIILDGWRDEAYFHQVVRKFYEKGHLDVLVRFQTAFSTRRINLEEREGTLERVRMHLPLIETPAMEETRFYQEGAVLIYHLDNSIPSRLTGPEIREVFDRQKIETWGDQIRIGRFARDTRPLMFRQERLAFGSEQISAGTESVWRQESLSFSPAEAGFLRVLNEDVSADPNLLQLIRLRKTEIDRIAFYNHGQLAFCGRNGSVGVLTGFNDRVYETRVHDKSVAGMAVVGGDVCSVDAGGELAITSFKSNTVTPVVRRAAPALVVAPFGESSFVTGHTDGTVRVWDLGTGSARVLRGHRAPVLAVAADRRGRVFSGSEDGQLRVWNLERGRVNVFETHETPVRALDVYVDGRVVIGAGAAGRDSDGRSGGGPGTGNVEAGRGGRGGCRILVFDAESGACDVFDLGDRGALRTLNVYFDGRIIVGLDLGEGESEKSARNGRGLGESGREGRLGSLVVLDPRPDFLCYNLLSGHEVETRDCVSMGPRIITCGSEKSGERTLTIWGTATYVAKELGKLRLMPETMGKPPYYRSLF